jgi:hypothetical protein
MSHTKASVIRMIRMHKFFGQCTCNLKVWNCTCKMSTSSSSHLSSACPCIYKIFFREKCMQPESYYFSHIWKSSFISAAKRGVSTSFFFVCWPVLAFVHNICLAHLAKDVYHRQRRCGLCFRGWATINACNFCLALAQKWHMCIIAKKKKKKKWHMCKILRVDKWQAQLL